MAKQTQTEREIVINEDQENMLKTALQLGERRRIPQPALELFRDFKVSLDRVGIHHVSPEIIAMIPILLNRVARPAPQTFVDEVQEHGDVKYGTRIVATWRGKPTMGRFLRFEKGKAYVELDGDRAEERAIGVTEVRLATREDLHQVGEEVEEE